MKRILVILFVIVFFAFCSRVFGTYVNESGGLYDQIEFVGNTSCTITTLVVPGRDSSSSAGSVRIPR